MKAALLLLGVFTAWGADAKKQVLQFDPEKGVIMVEEGEAKGKNKSFAPPSFKGKKTTIVEERISVISPHVVTEPVTDTAFYRTGLRFFKNGDYDEALKYFENAWQKKEDPLYLFWKGACLRNLSRFTEMDSVFKEIVDRFPKNEVADDALFYLADQAQKTNDFQLANVRLRDLIDLYPEGLSILGGIDYREEAKKRIRVMKIDIVSRLKLLDYGDKNPVELLKAFQGDNGLESNGYPNKKTVELLIQKSDAIEHRVNNRISESEALFNQRAVYYGFTLFLLLFNLIWGLRNITAVTDRSRRIELLVRETP